MAVVVDQSWDAASVWCFRGNDRIDAGERLDDALLSPLPPERLVWARHMLAQRSVVVLNDRQRRAIGQAGVGVRRGAGRHYLVRSVVYAGQDATPVELAAAARNVRFEIQWFRQERRVRVLMAQSTPPPNDFYAWNFPMVLRTRAPVREVTVGCYPIR